VFFATAMTPIIDMPSASFLVEASSTFSAADSQLSDVRLLDGQAGIQHPSSPFE
jgi:hypothetical protein